MNEELLAKCSCAHCGTHLEFPVEAAGARVNCPHCGQVTEHRYAEDLGLSVDQSNLRPVETATAPARA